MAYPARDPLGQPQGIFSNGEFCRTLRGSGYGYLPVQPSLFQPCPARLGWPGCPVDPVQLFAGTERSLSP